MFDCLLCNAQFIKPFVFVARLIKVLAVGDAGSTFPVHLKAQNFRPSWSANMQSLVCCQTSSVDDGTAAALTMASGLFMHATLL
jgi:hypothetical protein